MPAAVAVPLALAGVSLISQNANNKAAIKNNEVQQASAVGNAKEAYAAANQNVNAWEAAHPAPFSGAAGNVGPPPAPGSYGPGGQTTPSTYGIRAPAAPVVRPPTPPTPQPPKMPAPTGGPLGLGQSGGGAGSLGPLLAAIMGGAH